ncbi:MAG: hypothetical protein KDJ37_04680 [Hyphomicrobiaceae bacterium]|nr:hypothetical protein [Hyphomicrobiaceae bacterium]
MMSRPPRNLLRPLIATLRWLALVLWPASIAAAPLEAPSSLQIQAAEHADAAIPAPAPAAPARSYRPALVPEIIDDVARRNLGGDNGRRSDSRGNGEDPRTSTHDELRPPEQASATLAHCLHASFSPDPRERLTVSPRAPPERV